MSLRSVEAHQSGDGVTIAHCPFCGSGQVIGRSDGNAECSFCNQAFMVRVQPMFSAFPQTVDGMPVDIPGMPSPAPMPGMDPMGGGMPPGAEGAPGEEGAVPFGEDGGEGEGEAEGESGPPGEEESEPEEDGGGGPPFGKKESFRTASGQRVGRAEYVAYLAGLLRAR